MNLQGWKGRHKYGFVSRYEDIKRLYNFTPIPFVKDSIQSSYMLFSVLQ